MKVGAALLAAALAGACQVGEPAPVPWTGQAPGAIAVWPDALLDDRMPGAGGGGFGLEALSAALAARGYRTTSPAVAAELLAQHRLDRQAGTAAVGAALGVDAVLKFAVREFAVRGRRPVQDASWDVEWCIEATGGGVLWSYPHRGTFRPPHADFGDPHRPLDAPPDVVPIGGRGPRGFQDAQELLAHLHRMAMARLPRRQ